MAAPRALLHYTGAASHLGPGTGQQGSLGNYTSSVVVSQVSCDPPANISGVAVSWASPENMRLVFPERAGMGTLRLYADPVAATKALSWRAPRSAVEGAQVDVTAGGTFLLADGVDPSAELLVSVDAAVLPDGGTSDALALSIAANRLFDDIPAGIPLTQYRCLALVVGSTAVSNVRIQMRSSGPDPAILASGYAAAGTVTVGVNLDLDAARWPKIGSFQNMTTGEVLYYRSRGRLTLEVDDWGRGLLGTLPAVGTAGDTIRWRPQMIVGVEAPSAQPNGNFTTIPDEFTPPGAIVFDPAAWDQGVPLAVGPLNAGDIYGIWIARWNPLNAGQDPSTLESVEVLFDIP